MSNSNMPSPNTHSAYDRSVRYKVSKQRSHKTSSSHHATGTIDKESTTILNTRRTDWVFRIGFQGRSSSPRAA